MKTLLNKLEYFISFLFSIILYHLHYGLGTIGFTNINWILKARHDWGSHYLGWSFYRLSDWQFPIGKNDFWYYPIYTNVGLSDSIPLLSIPLKVISPLLPQDFQYFGIWLFSCYVLNAFFTIKLTKLFTTNKIYTLIVVLFVLICPIFLYRGLHPSLCAHWLIIGSIYYYFKPITTESDVRKNLKNQLVLLVLSGLIHPYLTMIVIGFTVITPLKFYYSDKKLSLKNFILYIAISLAILVALWGVIGLIFNANLSVNHGYGLYSWNLNSFFNPDGFSSFIPQLNKYSDRQYEGYSYLGVGMMILIIISTIIFIKNYLLKNGWFKKNKTVIGIFLLWVIPLTLFGISNVITYNEKLLFTIPLPDFIVKFGSIFRAASRFIWLLYYVIFLGSLFIFIKSSLNKFVKVFVLIALLSLQFYDLKIFMSYRNLELGKYENPVDEKLWGSIFSNFEHVSFYPLYSWSLVNHYDYQDFGYIAYQNNCTFTSAYVARVNDIREREVTSELLGQLFSDNIDEKTVYITNKDNISSFSPVIWSGKAVAYQIGDYFVIFSSKKNIPLSESIKNTSKNITTNILKPNVFREINTSNKQISDNIKFNVEFSKIAKKFSVLEGWAVTDNQNDSQQDSIFIAYKNNDKFYVSTTIKNDRDDIAKVMNNPGKLSSGFKTNIYVDKSIFNNYPVGILIKDSQGNLFFSEIDKEKFELSTTNSIVKLKNIPVLCKNESIFNIDKVDNSGANTEIFGWFGSKSLDNNELEKSIILSNSSGNYLIETTKVDRGDVQDANKDLKNGSSTGFIAKFSSEKLSAGQYKVYLHIKNTKTREICAVETASVVTK